MDSNRRDKIHAGTRAEIKAIAWRQIAGTGAAALSLGAIAREMGLTTPALYRYFSSRDELVSALTRDAYLSFCEALESARDARLPDDHAGRFRSLCLAYRAWAIANPQQYMLIFGAQVPGYRMAAEAGEAADRSFLTLLGVMQAADQAGRINLAVPHISLPPGLKAQLEAVQHPRAAYPGRVTYLALASWSFIHGITSLELYRRYSLILQDRTDEFLSLEIDRFMDSIGFA